MLRCAPGLPPCPQGVGGHLPQDPLRHAAAVRGQDQAEASAGKHTALALMYR